MLDGMDWFLEKLKNKTPFGFARFNDGEMLAIKQVGTVVARGDQYVDKGLSTALRVSLEHKQENYFIGIPCSRCYPEHYKSAKDIVGDYEYLTKAVATTNRNWKHFIDAFPGLVKDRRMIWIGGADQNIDALKKMGLNIAKAAKVPARNSWDFYKQLKEVMPEYFESGDIVGVSLGPTARVLVQQWFKNYTDITFIDMGSNLDPFTRDVWHNCHKGWEETGFNLTKLCEECN